MTCGLAVKRPHDYKAYLSPDAGVEVKRSRATNAHCSPFRPQLGTLATSLMQSTCSSKFAKEIAKKEEQGPFPNVSNRCHLSDNQLESYLRAEVQYLKRRKLIPFRNPSINTLSAETSSTNCYRRPAASPSSSHSGSESDGEPCANIKQKVKNEPALSNLYEKPQFSLKQVKLICERLLKEQEIHLRYEYETVLNKKLEEQHNQYVQFAKEQIESHNSNDNDFFYLS